MSEDNKTIANAEANSPKMVIIPAQQPSNTIGISHEVERSMKPPSTIVSAQSIILTQDLETEEGEMDTENEGMAGANEVKKRGRKKGSKNSIQTKTDQASNLQSLTRARSSSQKSEKKDQLQRKLSATQAIQLFTTAQQICNHLSQTQWSKTSGQDQTAQTSRVPLYQSSEANTLKRDRTLISSNECSPEGNKKVKNDNDEDFLDLISRVER